MATTEALTQVRIDRNRIVLGAVAVLVAIGVAIVLIGQRRPPQMGADQRVFHTVDALYTAVKSQDLTRLGECERRLHDYRDAGTLPAAAAARLDGVIGTAKSGGWQSAAESLYDFMLGQRREGADVPRAKPAKTAPRRRA
jgi:hypothetical protein